MVRAVLHFFVSLFPALVLHCSHPFLFFVFFSLNLFFLGASDLRSHSRLVPPALVLGLFCANKAGFM